MADADAGGVVRRPAVPAPIRIRRNLATLAPTDPIVTFYGRAIAEMKKRPITDPLSWRYQAAIHDYDPAADPNRQPGETLPSATEQGRFWNACQHASWFFLPWHRMYLHHFEKIVMSHVVRLGGPVDWALPYWNYSRGDASRLLPQAFRAGSTTGLFIPQRDPNANAGNPFATATQTDLAALNETVFSGVPGGSPGFGGLQTPNNHAGGPAKGRLESVPHDRMHGAVNGSDPSNFMGNFTRAPLDPIFWVHHCNIDRLWEVWVQTHANPTSSAWLNEPFAFHDATGAVVSMTSAQVVDTRAAPLSYVYDDLSP